MPEINIIHANFSPVRGDEVKMPEEHPSMTPGCLNVNERGK
jgi:hypothetical protein